MLVLTVKTLDSQNHSFTLSDEATVLSLKESILDKMSVPIAIQRLIYQGKVLQDDKKLTDYGEINGKVIHLVERPPPSANRSSDTANARAENGTTGTGAIRRVARRDGATFLGSVAFPGDLLEAQAIELPTRPSQAMARNRIGCAKRMIVHARHTIRCLEDPGLEPPTARLGRRPRRTQSETSTASPPTEDRGTSTNATTTPTPTASQMNSRPHVTDVIAAAIVGGPLAAVMSLPEIPDQDQEVAIEVEIESSDAGVEPRFEGEPTVRDNSDTEPRPPNQREDGARAEHMAPLLDELEGLQRRLQPFLFQARDILATDPSFDGNNSSLTYQECVRIFNGVSECLHNLAHACHAISDLMVDFEEDAPRSLRCRPVVLQQSTILETGIPIRLNQSDFEAQINVRRVDLTGSVSTDSSAPTTDTPPVSTTPTMTTTVTSTGTTPTATTSASESAPGTAPLPSDQSRDNGVRFQINGPQMPDNLEIFMDFGPDGVTVGSLETSPFRTNVNIENRNATPGNDNPPTSSASMPGQFELIPEMPTTNDLRAFVALPAVLQTVQSFAGHLQNQLMSRLHGPNSANGQGAGTATATVSGVFGVDVERDFRIFRESPSLSTTSTPATSSGATPTPPAETATTNVPPSAQQTRRSDPSNTRHSTANTQTGPPRRAAMLPGAFHSIFQRNFDPLLPCSSHHIRSTRQSMQSRGVRTDNGGDIRPLAQLAQGQTIFRRGVGSPVPTGRRGMVGLAVPAHELANVARAGDTTGFFFNNIALPGYPPGGFDTLSINLPISQFLDSICRSPYVEGQSIVSDLFMALARNLTWLELMELSMSSRVNQIFSRIRTALTEFAASRLLDGERPSATSYTRACARLFTELLPYIDSMHQTGVRDDSVDFFGTIRHYNQNFLTIVLSHMFEGSTYGTFGSNLTWGMAIYIRGLLAIVKHCCQNSSLGVHSLIRDCVRRLLRGAPLEMREWAEFYAIYFFNHQADRINVPIQDILRHLIYLPNATSVESADPVAGTTTAASTTPVEAMETESILPNDIEPEWPDRETLERLEKEAQAITAAMANENLPEVLIGSEPWHASLPSDWVPVIARDTQRQRRQSSQKPLSDAYQDGMAPKRRKIMPLKPCGDISDSILDNVRRAALSAGLSPHRAHSAAIEASQDTAVRQAYLAEEKAEGSTILRTNPDFKSTRFPNASKYFK